LGALSESHETNGVSMKKASKILAVFLPAVLVAIAAPLGVSAATADDMKVKASPEETFEAVFFGAGELGKELSTVRQGSAEETTPEVAASRAELMSQYEQAHPGAIQDFYETVTEGSVAETRSAIQKTSAELVVLPGMEKAPGDAGTDCIAWAVGIYLAITLWVYVDLETSVTRSQPPELQQYIASVPNSGTLELDRVALAVNSAM